MPVTQTGRNVESLVIELSEVRKQLDRVPGQFQDAINGLLVSVRAELTEHRERFIGVLRAEQSEAAKLRKDNTAQQHRIEELLAELGQVRLELARTDPAGLPGPSAVPPGNDAEAPEPGPQSAGGDTGPAAPQAEDPASVLDPTTTSEKEPTMSEPYPQPFPPLPNPEPENVPQAVRDYVRQILAEQLPPTTPQEPAADEQTTPAQVRAAAPRPGAGGTADLIPPALAWPAHIATLRKASAVNELVIVCHPHTWDLLRAQVRTNTDERNPHFTDPARPGHDQRPGWERATTDPDKQGDNVLSGRSAVALLNALHETVHAGLDAQRGIETWALAVTAYERIAEVVNGTRPVAGAPDGPDNRPHVVLDDRGPEGAEHR